MAKNMNLAAKAKEFITTAPFSSVLMNCFGSTSSANNRFGWSIVAYYNLIDVFALFELKFSHSSVLWRKFNFPKVANSFVGKWKSLISFWELTNYYSFRQTIKYVQNASIGNLNSAIVGECISELKRLGLGLTEGEIIQIANLAPQSDVE